MCCVLGVSARIKDSLKGNLGRAGGFRDEDSLMFSLGITKLDRIKSNARILKAHSIDCLIWNI